MVTLRSSVGHMFKVETLVAQESKTVRNIIEDTGTEDTIPLPNVASKILAKVIEYARYHVEAWKSPDEKLAIHEDEIQKWDSEFIKVDQTTLYGIILAANYLNYQKLLDLGCQTIADRIKRKTPEEIRKTFNDITPEEYDMKERIIMSMSDDYSDWCYKIEGQILYIPCLNDLYMAYDSDQQCACLYAAVKAGIPKKLVIEISYTMSYSFYGERYGSVERESDSTVKNWIREMFPNDFCVEFEFNPDVSYVEDFHVEFELNPQVSS